MHNKDEATCVRVRGYACAKFRTNWLERVWTRTNENERGCDERKRVCVCVGEGGGELAWWRGNVCERNAAKKSGHVCRQQINENKVAWSSYSGAERSASIYTTQGSDLIWETDLHPRWRGRGKGNDAKEEEEEGEEGEGMVGMEATAGTRRTGWKSDRRKRIHRCLLENSLPRSTFSIGRIEWDRISRRTMKTNYLR